jgi:hypothetical protein
MPAESPVLLIMDCCAAAGVDLGNWANLSAGERRSRSNKELIAASGFHEQAPEPGEYSMTNNLIDALYDIAGRAKRGGEQCTASELHGLTKAKALRMYVPGLDTVKTPMYEILNNGGQSIVIAPTPAKRQQMLSSRRFRSSWHDVMARREQRKEEKLYELDHLDLDSAYSSSVEGGEDYDSDSGYSSDSRARYLDAPLRVHLSPKAAMKNQSNGGNRRYEGNFSYAATPRTVYCQPPDYLWYQRPVACGGRMDRGRNMYDGYY